MIKIKVYPGPLATADILDEDGYVLVEEGATVGALLKELRVPKFVALVGLYTVNHRQTKTSTKMNDGDILSIIAPPSGG
jgi:molybdopterin converting factor small subunit